MLETVIFFTVVSVLTEIILMMHLPKWVRRSKWLTLCGLIITLLVTAFNFWVGFGTVTGTLTAKLAFLGGFVAVPCVRWLSTDRTKRENKGQFRLKMWLWARRVL